MLKYIDFVTNNDEEFLNSFKDVKIENGKLDVNEVMDTCNYRLGNRIICSNNTIIIDEKTDSAFTNCAAIITNNNIPVYKTTSRFGNSIFLPFLYFWKMRISKNVKTATIITLHKKT